MRVTLDVERGGEKPRRLTLTQLIDLGVMPRVGDRVYVLTDPNDPERAVLAPSPTGAAISVPGADALDQDAVRDALALSPRLREHGKTGIATVVAMAPTATSALEITLDIDAIGTPPRRVTITQVIAGPAPAVGDRRYVLVDPTDPAVVALVPPGLGGQGLPKGANRLDPLVLGPELSQKRAKAQGTVLSATPERMNNPLLEQHGASKWRLALKVRPANGAPA